ncbi:MAG TPA: SRPBCC family protein [Pirellulaceae bacterium]|nr:SRPBCC family protein [Pirellulaceae bacterium]
MRPIRFACTITLPMPPEEIAWQILDVANWQNFRGYGPLPGIRVAEYEVRTPAIVGSRIRVTNRDGSTHVEEIVQWQPDERLRLRMGDFSPPLSRLATHFVESWEFQWQGSETRVTRAFEMHARSLVARSCLWMVSWLLKAALSRHLRELKKAA